MAEGLITRPPLDQPFKTPTTWKQQAPVNGAQCLSPCPVARDWVHEVQTDFGTPIWGPAFRFDTHLMQAGLLSGERIPAPAISDR